eukprot:TRINITY_DN3535_c0_g3_i1.p1 TRINITY_DN3535_c0_g3~~TRINITY_DN3535_c0_g3_i1.p1  ORF type:complete len:123 (+),score=30.78 TRINITY_DN3535_c0_g3_i1:101-469(+)
MYSIILSSSVKTTGKGKKKPSQNQLGGAIRRKKVEKSLDPYPFHKTTSNESPKPSVKPTTNIPPTGGIARVPPEPSKDPDDDERRVMEKYNLDHIPPKLMDHNSKGIGWHVNGTDVVSNDEM